MSKTKQSDIMTKASAHYEGLGIRKIDVPEWGVSIYSTPMTMAEKKKVMPYATGDDGVEFLIRTLILKAEDESGKKLFTIADRLKLLVSVSSDVIARIVNEIVEEIPIKKQEEN